MIEPSPLVVIRETGTLIEGMWFDRPAAMVPLVDEGLLGPGTVMVWSGEFEEYDNKRAEVYVPEAYLDGLERAEWQGPISRL